MGNISEEQQKVIDKTTHQIKCEKCKKITPIYTFEHTNKKKCMYCGNVLYINSRERFKESILAKLK